MKVATVAAAFADTAVGEVKIRSFSPALRVLAGAWPPFVVAVSVRLFHRRAVARTKFPETETPDNDNDGTSHSINDGLPFWASSAVDSFTSNGYCLHTWKRHKPPDNFACIIFSLHIRRLAPTTGPLCQLRRAEILPGLNIYCQREDKVSLGVYLRVFSAGVCADGDEVTRNPRCARRDNAATVYFPLINTDLYSEHEILGKKLSAYPAERDCVGRLEGNTCTRDVRDISV